MQALWLKGYKKPGQIIIMSALTRGIVLKNIVKPLKDIAGNTWNPDGFNKSEMVYEYSNGSLIYFMSMDREESFIGVKSTDAFFDESNLSNYAGEIISQVATRCSGNIYLCFNPSRRPEWLEELEKRDDVAIIHSTWRDNRFLEQTIIDEILERSKYDDVYDKVYNKGIYAIGAKEAIFNNFTISDDWPFKFDWQGFGLDFGFTQDETAGVQVRFFEGKLYVREVLYETGLDTSNMFNKLSNIVGREIIDCDNSEPRLVHELTNKGLRMTPTRKYAGSILDGIRSIQSVPIVIHSDSENLIREIQDYRWKKTKGVLVDIPADRQKDHLIDALRYVVMARLNINTGKYSYR